jgi:hypothetical protein
MGIAFLKKLKIFAMHHRLRLRLLAFEHRLNLRQFLHWLRGKHYRWKKGKLGVEASKKAGIL